MIVEDELDGGAGGTSDVDKLEEFDELSAAMAIPDRSMDLAGEQIPARARLPQRVHQGRRRRTPACTVCQLTQSSTTTVG
jgi:hypothetical protein